MTNDHSVLHMEETLKAVSKTSDYAIEFKRLVCFLYNKLHFINI